VIAKARTFSLRTRGVEAREFVAGIPAHGALGE